MKRVTLLSLIAIVLVFAACKGGSKKDETGDTNASAQTPAAGEEQKSAPANQPKEYKVTITPDSAILGRKKEALVKLMGGTAIAMTDPDGKDNGIELIVKLAVTNREHIGDGSSVAVYYSESRLQLDNGNNITAYTGTNNLSAQPEASSNEEGWTYKIPAGAKPTALNLFMDGTRVSVNLSLSE